MSSANPTGSAAEAYPVYLAAILDGDRRTAFGVVDRARAEGASLQSLYMDVFQPALREIGQRWQSDEISIADEHLATAITQSAMAHAFQHLFDWGTGHGRSLVAACADLERHEVGLRMICDLLELEGWDTTFLGASVPQESLVEMVRQRKPDALALSAAIPPHLARLRQTVDAVRGALGGEAPFILVGGRPFIEDPTLATRLGADLTAPDAVQAVELLQQKFARQ
jgi:MerR family transcriptional regulator, light-induced transcriptional regulator